MTLQVHVTNINLVRARAANPDGFVKDADGTNAANYVITQYPASGYPFDTRITHGWLSVWKGNLNSDRKVTDIST